MKPTSDTTSRPATPLAVYLVICLAISILSGLITADLHAVLTDHDGSNPPGRTEINR